MSTRPVSPWKSVEDQSPLHEVLQIEYEYYHPDLAYRIVTVLHQTLQPIVSIQDQLSSAQLGSVEANLGYGRLIGKCEIDLRLFGEWLRLCDSSHPKCKRSPGRIKVQPRHLWVVNVREHRVMRAPPNCAYIALSYVWGPVDPIRLTMGNAEILQQKDSLLMPHIRSRIPQTIQDAIFTASTVNVEFLWVDTLCLPQDELETRQELMQQMHQIYDNAVFTIVAAAGKDANRGLAGLRTGSRHRHQQAFQIRGRTFLDVDLDLVDGVGSGYQYSSWRTRAWTYEEALFSSRQLVFTEQRVYWYCPQTDPGGWREDIMAETTDAYRINVMEYCGAEVLYGRNAGDRFDWRGKNDFLKFSKHGNEYSQRQLTRPHDALNAFKGIESAIKVGYSEFIWGIPEVEFTRGLCWYSYGSIRGTADHVFRDNSTKNRRVAFPSWCWANWRHPVSTKPTSSWKRHNSGIQGLHFYFRGKRLTTFYERDADGKFAKVNEGGTNIPSRNGFDQNTQIESGYDEQEESTPIEASFPDMAILRFRTRTASVFIRCYEHRKIRALNDQQFMWEDYPSIFCLEDVSGKFIATSFVAIDDDRDFVTDDGGTTAVALKPAEAVAIAGGKDSTTCLLTVGEKNGCRSRIGIAHIYDKGSIKVVNDWLSEIIDNNYSLKIPDDTIVKGWEDIRSPEILFYLN
ncbi:hypothetical protein BP6252_12455 [Coleophoma cylindrospora]|uniref:Heterokaryon incompatibility domain-containing protein n=1 Tax=Coleophoma cylindrospora TaxID=1849047 RepID=A0A3D8QGX2_9HELO|nr:hypothetical protein BP6252_12455 [Coleophoma cylindrospora]